MKLRAFPQLPRGRGELVGDLRARGGALCMAFLLVGAGCVATPPAGSFSGPPEVAPTRAIRAVARLAHDTAASTQGLAYFRDALIESTGGYGTSSLRKIPLKPGGEYLKVDLPETLYGEGVTELRGRLFQITWHDQIGFIYDANTFEELVTFTYHGQGWGLATDGVSLIMSDGTSRLRYYDPDTFEMTSTLEVRDGGYPIRNLNELEWIEGEIWANVWFKDKIAVIDPLTGMVRIWIDLAPFLPAFAANRSGAVANGIAYDVASRRLFLTGKNWPHIIVAQSK